MLHVDPWGKAAECDRALAIVADPERRDELSSLRSLWIALGEAVFNTPECASQVSRKKELSKKIALSKKIEQIHTELMLTCRSAMH